MIKLKAKQLLIKIFLILLGLVLFLPIAASIYFYQNKTELIDQLTAINNRISTGKLTYEDVEVKSWEHFPNATLSFKNLSLVDTSTAKHKRFTAKEFDLRLSLESILKKKVQIKSIQISGGTFSLDDYSELTEDEVLGNLKTSDSLMDARGILDTYFKKRMDLEINDLGIRVTNKAKNKNFEFRLNKLTTTANTAGNEIEAESEIVVDLQALGFNLDKGTFGNGAQLSGHFNSVFDLSEEAWEIEPFDLMIDEQLFNVGARFVFKKQVQYSVVFENENTAFEPSLKLLSRNIAERLGQINLSNPINTRISLDGRFIYKGNPVVRVDFRTENNLLSILDSIPVDNVSLSGQFVNRFYEDERAVTEDIKNYSLQLDDFKGNFRGLDFILNDFHAYTSPEAEHQLRTELISKGVPTEFNGLIPNQILSFDEGAYELKLDIDGDLVSPVELLERSSGQMSITDTKITNSFNGVSTSVTELRTTFKSNTAYLQRLLVPLNRDDHIEISGQIDNISGLLQKQNRKSLQTTLELKSDRAVWADFLALYRIGEQRSDPEKKPHQLLRETLISLYQNYNPNIKVSLKNFYFKDLYMRNFKTGISYDGQHLLKLDETSFDVDGGKFVVDAALDLENRSSLFLNGKLEGTGDVDFLAGLFTDEVFTVEGGQFKLNGSVNGDLSKENDVFKNSEISLKVEETAFVYKSESTRIPIREIDLDLQKNNAVLNKLKVILGEEDEIEFSGNLENFSDLLFKGDSKKVASQLNVYSSRLQWDDFFFLFRQDDEANSEESKSNSTRLKNTLQDIFKSVRPEFIVDIEMFDYGDDMTFRDFHSNIYFKDEATLVFNNTRLKFGETGDIGFNAVVDISSNTETPISIALDAVGDPDDLDLLFNESAFSMLGGKFSLETSTRGNIEAIDQLIAGSNSHLIVENSNFFHEPTGVSIPCKLLDVTLENNNAFLNDFTAVLPSGHEMKFSGLMKNASFLFLKDLQDAPPLQSELLLESEDLVFDEFVNLFKIERKAGTSRGQPIVLKEAVKDFYRRYQPSLKVDIEKFAYDRLYLQNLVSGFHFENENQFYLESTAFDFYEGKVGLDAHFDLTDPNLTPFAFGFSTETLDLEKLLEAFEYFGMESLEEADKIAGSVSINSELQGDIIDSTGIDIKSMKGNIAFDLEEMRLVNFEPLITVANKVFKKERFQDIRFQPITDTLYLSQATLEIPLMEIQSTAIQLFVMGHLGFEDVKTNIWTAIPLSNFKSRDLKQLPDKKGYIESGKKVYVEAKTAKDGSIKYVLHLNPKKYYQERGLISNYRQEIKNYRYQRRRYKRDNRRAERESRKSDSPDG